MPGAAMIFAPAQRGSYSATMGQYVIRGGKWGYERLQVQARTWLPTTSALLDRIHLGPGMRCLGLGGGGGDVTFEFVRRVGPGGSVVGVDMDEVKVGLARETAMAHGQPGVEFQVMNVYEWAEPATCDLVYCRKLLQHLSRPIDVLRTGGRRSGRAG